MISAINMKEIKRKVSSAYFADGLWDVLLGLFIMAIPFYIGPMVVPVMSLICYVVGYLVVLQIRERITYPRIGYIKTPRNRIFSVMLWLCFAMVFILLGFSILRYILAYSYDLIGPLGFLKYFQSTVFAAIIAFMAYRYGVKRWYLYSLWIFAGFSFGRALLFPAFGRTEFSAWPFNFSFYITGGVILLAGIVTLIRFIRNNPKIEPEALNEQA
jgi:hypothetical protein